MCYIISYVSSPSHYLGGVEFAVVQLQNVQCRLQVGLGLRQLHLDGSQTVGVRRGQVHPQQRQIHLQDEEEANTPDSVNTSPEP